MIWAEPAHILMDSHIESENNWAKVLSKYGTGGYWNFDQVFFYFLWENGTGADAVVNVTSFMLLNGTCSAWANADWLPNVFGLGPDTQLIVSAGLTLFEWWNQPPTQPLRQPGQEQNVVTLSVDGGCCRWFFRKGKRKDG
jgi:hypothetical protein